MGSFTIKRGLDIKLAGAPEATVVDALDAATLSVSPADFKGMKPRLDVAEGAQVKRGSPLFHDKFNPALRACAPAGGTVKSIVLGPRRALERVVIQVDAKAAAESYPKYQAAQIAALKREDVLKALTESGLIALLQQRPFSRLPDLAATPKSIFINAMATAPFQVDSNVAVKGSEAEFQAGVDALSRLTTGKVHLCLDARAQNAQAFTGVKNAEVHTFKGPHPSGNTSVHISRIDPIKPHDVVWAIKAEDVISIGHLLLKGEYAGTKIVALGGHGVKDGQRKHYRVRIGTSHQHLLSGKLAEGELRVIRGDALAGTKTGADDFVRLTDGAITVLPEDRERHLLGWMMPGFKVFSASKSFASSWLPAPKSLSLGTNQHGELRPMVLTGLYDKYMPMNIMVDFLIRAILANDTEEAVKLGLLEVDPEDFALCAFACPSKMDLVSIVKKGLQDLEKEGI